MKKAFLLVFIAVLAIAPLSAVAQGPGEGGPVIEANIGGSSNIGSFNPLRCSGTDCQRIHNLIFPGLVGVDPEIAQIVPGEEFDSGALALRWEVNEDGTEYTFFLRDDAFWTDGTPITANDLKFSYDAIASREIESDLSGFIDVNIIDAEVIDDYTIKFTYEEASCDAVSLAGGVYPLPAHVFDGDYTNMVDSDFDGNPDVSAGVFQFARQDDGQIVLVPNQDYWGLEGEFVVPEGFIYLDVPDTTVAVERLLAGEINFLDSPERQRRQELIDSEDVQTFTFPANGWNYIGLNLADPTNPQNALDEDGNRLDQGHHPIFGDVMVRRALQLGMDVQEMIDIVSLGQGIQMAANEIPSSWAVSPELEAIPFDTTAAEQMLDEAGWVITDDSPEVDDNPIRICQGCQYAEEGAAMRFSLLLADGSPNAERLALLFKDQMLAIGVDVDVQIREFNTVVSTITSQEFDAALMAWSNAYPTNPDITQILGPDADAVGSGFNFVSYYNPEAMELNEQARTLSGCDLEERAALYWQVQEMLQADQPYLWMYTVEDMYAARSEVNGFAPYANSPFWNIDTWAIDTP